MRYVFLCDFDGTVAPFDIGADFVRHFGRGEMAGLERALEQWAAGEIGHRELTEVECSRLEVTEPEALAFTRRYTLDPEFAPFVGDAAAAGHGVEVVSEGFGFYIADLLGRAGLGDVPFSSNALAFEAGGRAVPAFPNPGGCGRCGNCKGERAREHRASGATVVMVGDGLSDRCGARAADVVLARGALRDWCRTEGVPAVAVDDFAGVRAWARDAFAALPHGGAR